MKSLSLLAVLLATIAANAYKIDQNMTGSGFFDFFDFFTDDDPTHGYTNFVDRNTAQADGLIYAQGNKIIIGSDVTNVASGRGRNTIRLTSKKAWKNGLFVLDAMNIPYGCGTWPAWWLVGPNWPNGGEIDIVEGVNTNSQDQTTLHTSANCAINNGGNAFTGKWGTGSNGQPATDCYVNAPGEWSNQGCGILGGGYGAGFNSNGGGVFALEWTESFIRSFYWPRNSVPWNVLSDSPNPDSWGQPYAYFTLGGSCSPDHFAAQNMVFDLTFCGDWAGSTFGQQCPGLGDCTSYVKNNPSAFKQAYWWLQQTLVFQK